MAKEKKGFILYADQKELFDQLSNEKAGELIKHIFSYVNDEEPVTNDVIINLAFTPIKQQLKRDLKHWESIRKKRSEAGKASAEARKQKSTNSTSVKSVEQKSTNSTVIDNVNVKEKVKDKVINISFDVFWNLYDKKVGNKGKCEKKWNSLKDEQREKIIHTLPKFKSNIKDKQFQPHPLTYLNNNRWEDEIQEVKPKKASGMFNDHLC